MYKLELNEKNKRAVKLSINFLYLRSSDQNIEQGEHEMPRRTDIAQEEKQEEGRMPHSVIKAEKEDEIDKLNRMLGKVMHYISDDEIIEIDIEYLLDNTKGLRAWWNEYREKDRKRVEDEIKESLSGLSLEELEKIHERIQEKGK